MPGEKILYRIIVKGRVQGVGFRQLCMKEARFRGISGFVENKSDGSVYIEAEASKEQLEGLMSWFSERHGYGSVEEIIVEPGTPVQYKSFTIRY